jgi:hypothetical protein
MWANEEVYNRQGTRYRIRQGHAVVGFPASVEVTLEPQEVLDERFRELIVSVKAKQTPNGLETEPTMNGRGFRLRFTPSDTGWVDYSVPVVFLVKTLNGQQTKGLDQYETQDSLPVPVWVNPTKTRRILAGTLLGLPILMTGLTLFVLSRARRRQRQQLASKSATAESNVEKEPEKARPAWNLAQIKLEAYFDRNLQQVNQIFLVAIGVMCVDFGFVLTGVVMSFHGTKITPVELVASGAGIITEFIGATFMVIYRSTMAQANEFMSILERINTVGMAVQVLDSIPETATVLKSETRAHIVELLLIANAHSKPKAKEERNPKVTKNKDAKATETMR